MDKQKLAYTRTFGCRANVSDGEKINGMLAEMGYGFTRDLNEADLILFNTCAIRENAETRVFGNIGSLVHQKRRNPDLIVAVCGCMIQQEGTAEKLRKTFPYIDLLFGTHALPKLPQLLQEVSNTRGTVVDLTEECGIVEDLPVRRTSSIKADVPIMYGCDNYCTYCVVPYVRGRERSRTPEAVLGEIHSLVTDGVKEIMLLGQNVNSYGKGLNCSTNFSELLRQIDAIDGEFRVTYMTSHPKDLSRELIDIIADSNKISHRLHLPVQSGSNSILKAMNRKYTIEQYLEIIEYARKKIPSISITTDIIVGFPGETREEFDETLELIRRARFDLAYTFIYSKRAGTVAAEFEDLLPKEIKSAWFTEMLGVLDESTSNSFERYVGKILHVLCEGDGYLEGEFTGKSREGIVVNFAKPSSEVNIVGEFVNIKITKDLGCVVFGEIVNN